jgi:hypothetical protein
MNCDTYLSMLATVPVEELEFGDPREHATHCRDCDRVTRVVAERERNMLMAYGELYPARSAAPITARALMMSRRRRIATYYRIGLAIATALTLLFLVLSRRVLPSSTGGISEVFRFQCLSPEQAVELLRPIRSPGVSVMIPPNTTVSTIRVTASAAEMEQVRSLLDRYDTPVATQCGAQLTVPKETRVPSP